MAKLIYTAITSLDGCIEDKAGNFDWCAPDEEVHAFINDLERPIGTYLYGRRMYDTMVYWETRGTGPDDPSVSADWALLWRAAEKIVYSRTLTSARGARTRIEHDFDPAAVRQLKQSSALDLSVGGAELAAVAMAAGLVDEVHLFVSPVLVGGGKRALPDDVRLDLDLLDEHHFGGGVAHLRYAVRERAVHAGT
ncbi:MAG TPA: dihydrofolate reductase family protein [Acidimicrobiales bacterium]|nr:dihydrofolate reductase family protein [Acidimicrobiales bacterium]